MSYDIVVTSRAEKAAREIFHWIAKRHRKALSVGIGPTAMRWNRCEKTPNDVVGPIRIVSAAINYGVSFSGRSTAGDSGSSSH